MERTFTSMSYVTTRGIRTRNDVITSRNDVIRSRNDVTTRNDVTNRNDVMSRNDITSRNDVLTLSDVTNCLDDVTACYDVVRKCDEMTSRDEEQNKSEEQGPENRNKMLQQSEQLVRLAYEERQQMKMMTIPSGKAYKLTSCVPVLRQIHRKLLLCSLCEGRYDQPKILPCFHSFCQACLAEYTPSNSLTLSCPVCRHPSILPLEGVSALQDNLFLHGLIQAIEFENICSSCQRTRALAKCTDCDLFVCDGCIAAHILETSTATAPSDRSCSPSHPSHHIIKICSSPSPDPAPLSAFTCSNHDSKSFEYFCVNCETAICAQCRGLEHVDHPTQSLEEAMGLHREDLRALLQQAYLTIERMRSALDQLSGASDDLFNNYRDTQTRITSAFDSLTKILQEQKETMISKLKTSFEEKRKSLNERSEMLEEKLISAENCCRFTESAVNQGDETELLMVRKEMSNRLSHLNVEDLNENLGDSSYLGFIDQDFINARKYLSVLGGVVTGGSEAPIEARLDCSGVIQCSTNTLNRLRVISQDSNSNKIKLCSSFFFTKLSSDDKKVKNQPVVCRADNDDVEIQYKISEAGVYSLDVRLFGVPIKGSPYKIRALDDVNESAMEESTGDSSHQTSMTSLLDHIPVRESKSTPNITKIRKNVTRQVDMNISSDAIMLRKPSRVRISDPAPEAVLSASRIPTRTLNVRLRGTKRPPSSPPTARHVTPNKTSQTRTDRGRAAVVKIGSEGREQGEFVNPQGVCFAGEKILVADSNNNCVQVFSASTGQFLRRLGKKGCLQGQMTRPIGVAVTAGGNYLVSDYDTRYVSVYNPHGKYLRKFAGTTQMVGPKGMCVDHEGRVIIVDNKGCCVYVHQADGKLLHKFGSRGYEAGQFTGPQYCAVTAENDIIISDFHHNTIKVFSRDGAKMKLSFGSAGDKEGQFSGPTGVAVHSTGHIVVADWGNSRIQVFTSEGVFDSIVDTSEDPLYGPQGLTVTPAGHVIVADSGHHCFKIFRNTPLCKKL